MTKTFIKNHPFEGNLQPYTWYRNLLLLLQIPIYKSIGFFKA